MTRTPSPTTRHSGLSQYTETRTRVGPLGLNTQGLPDQAAPGRAWFTYFRLYAPLEPYFDASWKLPDIEAI